MSLPAPARAQSTLFSDDFNRTTGLGANWFVGYGTFTTNGSYAVSGAPPINGNWASVVPSLGADDYSVTAVIVVPNGSIESGVFARSEDSQYIDDDLFALQLNTDGTVTLYRRNGWNWTELASAQAGITAGIAYTTELLVRGSYPVHLEGWVNGTQYIGFDDDTDQRLTTGLAGLMNYTQGVEFANFAVDSVPQHDFYDAFDRTDGLGSNWSVQYGSFTTDGSEAVSGSPPVNGNWAGVVPAIGTNDYAVYADMTIPSGSLTSGLVARSSVPGEFDSDLYSLQLSTDGTVDLYRRNSWNWTLLQSVDAGITAGTYYTPELIVQGSNPVQLEAWLDGTRLFIYDDDDPNQIDGGIPGMEDYDQGVTYTNFSVDPMDGPPTTVTVSGPPRSTGPAISASAR